MCFLCFRASFFALLSHLDLNCVTTFEDTKEMQLYKNTTSTPSQHNRIDADFKLLKYTPFYL